MDFVAHLRQISALGAVKCITVGENIKSQPGGFIKSFVDKRGSVRAAVSRGHVVAYYISKGGLCPLFQPTQP